LLQQTTTQYDVHYTVEHTKSSLCTHAM